MVKFKGIKYLTNILFAKVKLHRGPVNFFFGWVSGGVVIAGHKTFNNLFL